VYVEVLGEGVEVTVTYRLLADTNERRRLATCDPMFSFPE
jgi:hypothetical protein